MKRTFIVLVAVVVALSLASCAKRQAASGGKKQVRVAFVSDCVADFWLITKAGCYDAGRKYDARCEYRMPTSMTATDQKAQVEDLVVRGIDGLALSPIDPNNQAEMLNKLSDRGIKIVCSGSDSPRSHRLCYIGTSNLEAGRLVGREMLKYLPQGGKVMLFTHTVDLKNTQERIQGVHQALDGGRCEIIGIMVDGADRAKCLSNAEDCLTKHGDIVGMIGICGLNAPACASAVKAAHKDGKVKIVGFDAEEDSSLQAVKDGYIQSLAAQNPYGMGYEAVRVMAQVLHGEDPRIPSSGVIDTGVTVITKANVDAHWKRLRELKAKFRALN